MKNRNSRFLVLFFSTVFVVVSQMLQAQRADISADRTELFIGEHIKLKLKFEYPANSDSYSFPEFLNDTITRQIEIISSTPKTDTLSLTSDLIQLERTYIITSFDTGIHVIPPFPFSFTSENEKRPDTIFSDSLFLKVNLVDVDTTQSIMDIKSPWEIPFQWRDYIPHFIAGLLIVAVIVAVLYYFMRRKRGLPFFPERIIPALPPDEEALEALNKIKKEKIWRNGLIKDYYTSLTDTLRHYIERRFGIPAPEFTSAETILALRNKELNDETAKKLEHIFVVADKVKFAKGNPVSTENEHCLDLAYDFVLKTRPAETIEDYNITTNTSQTETHSQT